MSGQCIVVRPLSRANIRHIAGSLREMCKLPEPMFPIVHFMDVTLRRDWPGYDMVLLGRDELGNDGGRTDPDQKLVQIREDVYESARRGDGFGRFTMAHELGHLLLHHGLPFRRQVDKGEVKPFLNSEWQADAFAGELLMPVPAVLSCPGEASLMDLCGVSFSAARVRFQVLRQEGLIETTDP